VVRSWLNNRARVAFTYALERSGYAKDGSRLPGHQAGSGTGNLVGTVHISPQTGLLRASWKEVNRQADLVVECIEQEQRKHQNKITKRS
jgi:hypothetical protein